MPFEPAGKSNQGRLFIAVIVIAGGALIFFLSENPKARSQFGLGLRQSAGSAGNSELMQAITSAQSDLQDKLNEYQVQAAQVATLSNSVRNWKAIMDQAQAYAEDWMPQANSYLDEAVASDHQATKNMLYSMHIQEAGMVRKVLDQRDKAAAGYETNSQELATATVQLRQTEAQINMLRMQISQYNTQLVGGKDNAR